MCKSKTTGILGWFVMGFTDFGLMEFGHPKRKFNIKSKTGFINMSS